MQNLQRFGDSVEDLTESRMGMLVEELPPIDVAVTIVKLQNVDRP